MSVAAAGSEASGARRWRVAMRCVALLVCMSPSIGTPPGAAAQTSADESLRARVEAAIDAATDVPSDSIEVQVRGGVVTLLGSVVCDDCGGSSTPPGTGTVQQSLGALVRAIPGVERVEFRLRYRPA